MENTRLIDFLLAPFNLFNNLELDSAFRKSVVLESLVESHSIPFLHVR